mmetsp:Transcript_15598/g.26277  ORF Transcript_15598/g.26277 Transcript_15598/m.26277 type:complete len:269 (+) Transcript_15598:199-1005(+)
MADSCSEKRKLFHASDVWKQAFSCPSKRTTKHPRIVRATEDSTSVHLDNFDDTVLLRIFRYLTPLPDLFNIALVCRRFYELKNDERLWLTVTHRSQQLKLPRNFPTLKEAVNSSRPGDTIVLEAGVPHDVSGVCVRWPLHFMGSSPVLSSTQLVCPGGQCEAGLECWASCRITNLTIRANPLACCLRHHKGRLILEGCALRNESHPLDHLCSPIRVSHDSNKATGRISVIETTIEGGSKAISCFDRDRLQQVRVIYSRSGCTFWFEVV